ncbi:MAG: hypothetical protein JWM81_1081 [Candidatus Saccharibacteria bacterium]|nr:hypothetical protein [Candidatus Saccharibacteria bacterium]
MSFEHETPIQDQSAAKEFQLKYDDLLDRDIPGKLIPDFLGDANDAADESILAASVRTHVEFEMQGPNDNHIAAKKRAIINASIAAEAVVDLDSFLRDEVNTYEPVIYALQKYEYPGDVPGFLSIHFTIADGSRVMVRTRDGKDNPFYYVSPDVKYGVASPVIAHGQVIDNYLQGTRSYNYDSPNGMDGFMQGIGTSYPSISSGTLWPNTYRIPTFTHGNDDVIKLFTDIVDRDYTQGYTEHRSRRGGYLLLRQARFMGHVIADSLLGIADGAGILPVWQRQVADDYALEAVTILEKLQRNDTSVSAFANNYFGYLLSGKALELETLGVQPAAIVARAEEHAAQRGLQAAESDIGQIVDLLISD